MHENNTKAFVPRKQYSNQSFLPTMFPNLSVPVKTRTEEKKRIEQTIKLSEVILPKGLPVLLQEVVPTGVFSSKSKFYNSGNECDPQ